MKGAEKGNILRYRKPGNLLGNACCSVLLVIFNHFQRTPSTLQLFLEETSHYFSIGSNCGPLPHRVTAVGAKI